MKKEKVQQLFKTYTEGRQYVFGDSGNLVGQMDNPVNTNPFTSGIDYPYGNHFTGQMWQPEAAMPVLPVSNGQAHPPSNETIQTGRRLAEIAHNFENQPDKSIVKFEKIWIVEKPVEQIISIPVLRQETISHSVTKVNWQTCDKTALSGTHYVGSSGEIIFNQGDTRKEIQIQILKPNNVEDELRFVVEMNYGGYTPHPITVTLKKQCLEPIEMRVLENFPSLPFSISDIKAVLDGCLNARTFLMALSYLSSTTKDLDAQIALGCELSFLCIRKSSGTAMREDSILKILTDFFRRDDYDF